MINITGLKDHQQSRLLQHYATIKTWQGVLDQERAEFEGRGEVLPLSRVHEIEHIIKNEEEQILQVIKQAKNDDEDPKEFIDRVLGIIAEIKKHIYVLPDDIEKVVRAVLEQFEKLLKFAKELF